ncbi:hypothetical protein ACIPSA_28945 [Streptomyces sp. NPDC086549]|uniref:hypothetical protein n=1 Tax=Streptomyces sp. NPDC086549 TaxID=3365752 RepID=UPI003811C750
MCTMWSSRILNAADRIPGNREVRHRRYANWSMHPDSADALLPVLLALSIHSLVLDAVRQGRPSAVGMIGRIRLADVVRAATERPSHELFAGLPALDEDDRVLVDAVKILVYDAASVLHLARLGQTIRSTLGKLTAGLSASDPVCSDVV